MKRTLFLVIPFILLASSCVAFFPLDGIVGNGKIVTLPLAVNGFSSVKNCTSANVRIVHGSKASATVTVDENIQSTLDIHVENDTLIISTHPGKNIFRYSQFTVQVMLPALSGVTVNGSGDIAVSDKFYGQSLTLMILGSGDISGAFDYERVQATIMGSGDIKIVGSSRLFNGNIAGSGGIYADGLEADRADVTIHGSGSCVLRVDDSLNAKIYGSGSIYYYGSPSVSQMDAGSGSLKQLDL
jgi:hypothetical protein